MRASRKGRHISGAEGLYEDEKAAGRAVRAYTARALEHTRGKPDELVITVEEIKRKPKTLAALPVSTLKCKSPKEAEEAVIKILAAHGISPRSRKKAFGIMKSKNTMRGAALLSAKSARRLEPGPVRGVRISRTGIDKKAQASLSKRLALRGINTDTVKEALVLASKAAACPVVTAELCFSDDPHYSTGYVASGRLGYLRVPKIKKMGSPHGGRVLFITEDASEKQVQAAIRYLERTPALIREIMEISGKVTIEKTLGSTDS